MVTEKHRARKYVPIKSYEIKYSQCRSQLFMISPVVGLYGQTKKYMRLLIIAKHMKMSYTRLG